MKVEKGLLVFGLIILVSMAIVIVLKPSMQLPYSIKVWKDEALENALNFLEKEGYKVEESTHYIVFKDDSDFVTFYYNYTRRAGKKLPLDINEFPVKYWLIEFYSSKFNGSVGVDAYTGKIVYYECEVEPNMTLSYSEAYSTAKSFLKRLGYNVSAMELFVNKSQTLRGGTEYEFAWIVKSYPLEKESLELVVEVKVTGRIVSYYKYYVLVPYYYLGPIMREEFTTMVTMIGLFILNFILFIVSIIVVAKNYRESRLSFKRLVILTLIVFLAVLVQQVNGLNLTLVEAAPKLVPLELFLMMVLLMIAFTTIFQSLVFALEAYAARILEQKLEERWVMLAPFLVGGSVDLKRAFKRTLIGYYLSFVLIASSLAYMSIVDHFLKPVYTSFGVLNQLLSSLNIPSLILAVSVMAGLVEEIAYRAFLQNLVYKYTKNIHISVIVATILWSLLHFNYPIIPRWIKVGQIIVIGLMLGYAYYLYGIETVIVAHYVFDVLAFGLSLPPPIAFQTSPHIILFILIPLLILPIAGRIRVKEVKPSITVERRVDPLLYSLWEHIVEAENAVRRGRYRVAYTLLTKAFQIIVYKIVGELLPVEEGLKRIEGSPAYLHAPSSYAIVYAIITKYEDPKTVPDYKDLVNALRELRNIYYIIQSYQV